MTSRSVNGGEEGGEERALFQKVPAAVSLLPNYSYSISSSTAARCYFPYFLFAFFFCFFGESTEKEGREFRIQSQGFEILLTGNCCVASLALINSLN